MAVAVDGAVGGREGIRVVVARRVMRGAGAAVGVFDVVGIEGFEGGFFVVYRFGGFIGFVAVRGVRNGGELEGGFW